MHLAVDNMGAQYKAYVIKFIYKLIKIISICYLATGPYIAPNSMVGANLLVTPLWNVGNVSKSCLLEKNENENVTVIASNGEKFCNLEVFATSRTSIRILDESDFDNFLVIIERLGNPVVCPNIFIVINDVVEGSCTVVFIHNHLRLQLQGDISILLQESANSESVNSEERCPEQSDINDEFQPTWTCEEVKVYYKIIQCDKSVRPNHEGLCDYNFFSSCNSSLRKNEVYFRCIESSNQDSLVAYLVYHNSSDEIDFSENKIVSIGVDAFQTLKNVRVLRLDNNNLVSLPLGVFQILVNLKHLRLNDNELHFLDVGVFKGMETLVTLRIHSNRLRILQYGLFNGLSTLQALFAYANEIHTLGENVFSGLQNLEVIGLQYNKISHLDKNVFRNLPNLKIVALLDNLLHQLDSGIFRYSQNLEILYLGSNYFANIPETIFNFTRKIYFIDLSINKLQQIPNIQHLHDLKFINLKENPLIQVNKETFSRVPRNTEFYVSQHEVCECFVKDYVNCSAADERSPFLTCERLLSDRVLVAMMWLIGINALAGNIFVLILKSKRSEPKPVQDLFLINLAVSDLLMGLYMIVIASADIYFGEDFPMRAEAWRSGTMCKTAGAISTVSSEASVFFVTLISLDRFINIRFPYLNKKFNRISATVVIICTWVLTLALGIVPSLMAGLNYKFYDNSHVCIGLPLTLLDQYTARNVEEKINLEHLFPGFHVLKFTVDTIYKGKVRGLYFSVAVFLGLNGACYLVILVSYIEIMRAVRASSKSIGQTPEMKKQIRLAVTVAAIVATDFCCWFPVIVLGILVQLRLIILPPSVFAWSVTFVLPINSAINPYLYTIAAVISKYRKAHDSVRKASSLQDQSKSENSEKKTSVLQEMST